MDEQNAMESMITSAVFLLKKYVRTKRNQITEALREEEQAVIEPAQSLVTILKEAQQLVDHLEGSVKSLDVSFKMIDKKIRDKLTMATAQQNILRCRRNREITVSQADPVSSGNQLVTQNGSLFSQTGSQMSQLSISITPAADRIPGPRIVQSGPSERPQVADFRCPFCRSRIYNARPPLLRHISDSHPDHYQVFMYIYKLTPEAVFSSDEIGGSSQCNYCSFRERSKAPLLRHIQENHVDQYEYFVQIARLKQMKLPPNRPIAKPPTASIQQSQISCAASSPHPVVSPVKIHNSAIPSKKVNNARKSAQAGPAEACIPSAAISQTIGLRGPAAEHPLSRRIQSNQMFANSAADRSDHAYSCLKRPPPPQLQPQNKIRRTRKIQAEQNKSRYPCSYCEQKFSHKNNLNLHVKFYCQKSGTPTPSLLPLETTNVRPYAGVNDDAPEPSATCPSPSLSSCSGDGHNMADIRFGDPSFITSVTDLDVIVPDTRQDEIFLLTKSPRFRRICTDFK